MFPIDDPVRGDQRTDALIEHLNASGRALFTRTVLDGRSVLRVSIGARTTERHHLEAAWHLLQRYWVTQADRA